MHGGKSSTTKELSQASTAVAEVGAILDAIDSTALIERLEIYRPVGRKGYPLKALWRAYAASFVLNLPNMNTLIRRLNEDRALRKLCGFGNQLPHRTTFNRFRNRVSEHLDLVEASLRTLTDELKGDKRLKGFGQAVAVDSTTVKTHSNPSRKVVSDEEATWTAKTSDKA